MAQAGYRRNFHPNWMQEALRAGAIGLLLALTGCSEDSARESPGKSEAIPTPEEGNALFAFKVQSDRERQEQAQREIELNPQNDGWEARLSTVRPLPGSSCSRKPFPLMSLPQF